MMWGSEIQWPRQGKVQENDVVLGKPAQRDGKGVCNRVYVLKCFYFRSK